MVGQYVISKAGHDKGTIYLIVAEEGDRVFLADGRSKTSASPKKKSRKHLQPISASAEPEILRKLQEGIALYPEEIRRAIRQFSDGETVKSNY
ncbi:MAG: hypothetical protein ACI4FY_03790 [Acetatifactor sp.]